MRTFPGSSVSKTSFRPPRLFAMRKVMALNVPEMLRGNEREGPPAKRPLDRGPAGSGRAASRQLEDEVGEESHEDDGGAREGYRETAARAALEDEGLLGFRRPHVHRGHETEVVHHGDHGREDPRQGEHPVPR